MLRTLGLAAPLPCPLIPPHRWSWMPLCHQPAYLGLMASGQSWPALCFSLSLCMEASLWEMTEARQSQGKRRCSCPHLWPP